MTERRRRLIEVAFPLEEVSEHSRRGKYVHRGHISTLHVWWARRPLAACRAFIHASLVDDPEDDGEREELLKEVGDLASWDAVRKPKQVVRSWEDGGSGLTGEVLLERARQRILDSNDGKPPRLVDPFAGGGSIPLEALRLGCEVEASDLNPVAVLILKGTVEYPQKYGQPDSRAIPDYIREVADEGEIGRLMGDGDLVEAYRRNPLATDVRYWGHWMLDRAREELAEFYPRDPDGNVPVAYLWSRTVPCPNCGAEMPLIRQYWLARKDKKKVALKPLIDDGARSVDFEIVEGTNVSGNPLDATTSRGDAKCLLCNQVAKAATIKELANAGEMGARMTAVAHDAPGKPGTQYRADSPRDLEPVRSAAVELRRREDAEGSEFTVVPEEPVARHTQYMLVREWGLDQWGRLFTERQLLALSTLARLVSEAHTGVVDSGASEEYGAAVAAYLGIVVGKTANRSSTSCAWDAGYEKVVSALTLQALPMKWDFVETNPLERTSGGIVGQIEDVAAVIDTVAAAASSPATVRRADARENQPRLLSAVVADPPYYDSINYADLSDYFYVWLKRSLNRTHSDLFSLPLTPKREQIVMNTQLNGDDESDRRDRARRTYVEGMAQSFTAMRSSLAERGIAGVVFAHADPDAWATLISGLLEAGLIPDASWPIATEMQSGLKVVGQARLKTSVWMACRPRQEEAGEVFLGDFLEEMRREIRDRLLDFWARGIRGADFFISAIGPALSVYGRHNRVLRPDGSEVTVRDFLDLVRRESTQVALEQVLGDADLGSMDPVTRQYLTWVWSYSRAPLDAGEAIALCLATGAEYANVVREGSIAAEAKEKSKKVVRLRTIAGRSLNDEQFGLGTPARPAALIDQLQRARVPVEPQRRRRAREVSCRPR